MRDTFDQIIRAIQNNPVKTTAAASLLGSGIGAYKAKPGHRRKGALMGGILGGIGGSYIPSLATRFSNPQSNSEIKLKELSNNGTTAMSPREMLQDHYGSKLDEVIASAQNYRQNNPNVSLLQGLDNKALDSKIPIRPHSVINDFALAAGQYYPDKNELTVSNHFFNNLNDKKDILDHELTHAGQGDKLRDVMSQFNSAFETRDISKPNFNGIPEEVRNKFIHPALNNGINNIDKQQMPEFLKNQLQQLEYLTKNEAELEPRLADLKRLHFKNTGEIIDSPEKAETLLKKINPKLFDYNIRTGPKSGPAAELNFLTPPTPEDNESWIKHLINKMPGLVQNNNQPTNMKIGMNKEAILRGFQKRAQEKLGAITDNKASYNRFFVK